MHEVILATPGASPSVRASARPLDHHVSRMIWLATSLSLLALSALLPIFLSASLLLVFVALSFVARRRPVGAKIRLASFIGMVVFVFAQGGFGMQSESGTALLIAAMIVKQVEMRTARDAAAMLLFDLVAPFTAMLQNQTPGILLVSLTALFVASAASLALSESPGRGLWRHFARAGGMLLAVAPLAVVLYLVVPRLDAPLWVGRTTSSPGVSDQMDVSDWTRVINDYSTAFRVHFKGRPPAPSQLYYRGYVMWDFDGRRWTPGPEVTSPSPILGQAASRWASYRIHYEDRSLQRLFLLDYPTTLPPQSRMLAGGEVLPPADKMPASLDVEAGLPAPSTLTDEVRTRALALPEDSSPRTRALARQWRASGISDQQVVARAMRHFSSGYRYTLSPPPLDRDQSVDSFVFDTRQGFCMHYSSALTVLLRSAGIPARVVTGYASSEVSELGDYYRVRQADAHAWVEAWVGGSWVRLDPTSQVSSVRQENPDSWGAAWRNGGYEMGDWFKSYWDRWVSYYDAGAQEKTLATAREAMASWTNKKAGEPMVLLAWFITPIFVLMGLLAAWRWFRPPTLSAQRSRLMAWMDQRVPSVSPGEYWPSRLGRVVVLPPHLLQELSSLLSDLDQALFDPGQPAHDVSLRRRFAIRARAFFRAYAKLDKTPPSPAPHD